jgi:hypothetical protein
MRPREAGGGSAWPDARRPSGGGVSRSYAQPYGDSRESYLARVVEDKKVPSRTRLLAAAEVGSLAAWRTLRQYGIANRLELATTSWNSNAPQVRGIRRLRHRIRGRSVSARFSPVTDCPIRRAASSSVAAPVRRPNRCRRCFGRRISRASRRGFSVRSPRWSRIRLLVLRRSVPAGGGLQGVRRGCRPDTAGQTDHW